MNALATTKILALLVAAAAAHARAGEFDNIEAAIDLFGAGAALETNDRTVAADTTTTKEATASADGDVQLTAEQLEQSREAIDIALDIGPVKLCRKVATDELLGYYPFSNKPVYQQRCTGLCLFTLNKPRDCKPSYKSVKVWKYPSLPPDDGLDIDMDRDGDLKSAALLSKYVRVVDKCSCQPRECEVENADGSTSTYAHGAVVYNECREKCECSYGSVVNCCRQRKDWVYGMTNAERQRYVDAVVTVSTTLPYKTQYDALIGEHETLFFGGIHNNDVFLPWHRAYILQMEELLRQVDCRVTVPYWAWEKQASDPLNTAGNLFSPSYFGGDGGAGNCVTDGAFASPGWSVTPSAGGGCLQRDFDFMPTTATTADLNTLVGTTCPSAADYDCFRDGIEHAPGTHDHVHCIVNGHMCSTASTNDPLFFLHHCNIDRWWAVWQAQSAAHEAAYDGSPTTVMPGSNGYTPEEVLDLDNQPGGVCVEYRKPWVFWPWLDASLSLKSPLNGAVPRVRVLPVKKAVDESGKSTPWRDLLSKMAGMTDEKIAGFERANERRNSGEEVPLVDVGELKSAAARALGFEVPDEALQAVGDVVQVSGRVE